MTISKIVTLLVALGLSIDTYAQTVKITCQDTRIGSSNSRVFAEFSIENNKISLEVRGNNNLIWKGPVNVKTNDNLFLDGIYFESTKYMKDNELVGLAGYFIFLDGDKSKNNILSQLEAYGSTYKIFEKESDRSINHTALNCTPPFEDTKQILAPFL